MEVEEVGVFGGGPGGGGHGGWVGWIDDGDGGDDGRGGLRGFGRTRWGLGDGEAGSVRCGWRGEK